MKSRNSEAHRLETDYFSRLEMALAGREPSEAVEIAQSIREHIEEALGELSGEEVTLVQMANVLERLGPPEAYARQEDGARAVAVPPPIPQPASLSDSDRHGAADLVGKLWWAYLVAVIGLYVPIIDFRICSLIGTILLACALLGRRGKLSGAFRTAGQLAIAVAIVNLVQPVLTVLGLGSPAAGLIASLMSIGGAVLAVVIYWKVFGGVAGLLDQAGCDDEARRLRGVRPYYIVYLVAAFLFGMVVGVLLALGPGRQGVGHWEISLVVYLLLPVMWLFGWLLMLRPLTRARTALSQGGSRVVAPEERRPLSGWLIALIVLLSLLALGAVLIGTMWFVYGSYKRQPSDSGRMSHSRVWTESAADVPQLDLPSVPAGLAGSSWAGPANLPGGDLTVTFHPDGTGDVETSNEHELAVHTHAYVVDGERIILGDHEFTFVDGHLRLPDGREMTPVSQPISRPASR